MASIKDALWTAPLGGAVAPVIGAAVPDLRDKLFNIGADETKSPEEEKKKEKENTTWPFAKEEQQQLKTS